MKEAFPEIQVKKDLREHVLARPDTYLGSFVFDKYKAYVVKGGKITLDTVEYNPAFERTVIEVGSNCIDNVWRSQQFGVKCGSIRFEHRKDGTLSFWNDGLTIPVVMSKIPELKGMYNPTIVFGVFMSSTNYNDEERRRSSGRNGYGTKICNTFAKRFTVETQDEKNKLFFTQTWSNNMESVSAPVIESKAGKGYTKVEWLPDYERFKMSGLTEGVIGLITKYLYDVAMIAKVPVYINGELVPVRSLIDYAQSFRETLTDEWIQITTDTSDVVVMPSRPSMTVAFTNGIPNPDGGVHVDAWSRAIFSPLTGKINPKADEKGPKLTMAEVKSHFSIFIVCSLDNPTFNSQEKVKLTAPKPETTLKASHLTKIMKWNVISKIKELLESKLLRAQKKKLEGTKKTVKNIEKLEDANLAGTADSMQCYLLFCEGDSAKTFAVTGIEKGFDGKTGRDYFGILPGRGKILNVRNASVDKIADNKIIQKLIQAMGLEIGMDYTIDSNYHRLRYGHLMVLADADSDGTHIEGLTQNFLHKLFPSLLRRNPPFLLSMKTPIVTVTLKDNTIKKFYRLQAFKDFQSTSSHLFKGPPKYFKGLGTSNDEAVIKNFGERIVHYSHDDLTDESMLVAFGRKHADIRKQQVSDYDPESIMIIEDEDAKEIQMTFSSFIESDLITHSIASCDRSLPCIIDGLKEPQRKILYALITKKLFHNKTAMKVQRVSGIVGSTTEYIHGEDNLSKTMIGMAWNFVGSNNIPLLVPDGQFGSRLQMGDDAADHRYIFTKLQEIVPYIFREEDNCILNYIQGEDMTIEPSFYVPILPMILINGIRAGIGTGWSSKVPAYNPLDIVMCIKIWIRDNLDSLGKTETAVISDLPEITPWYQGFIGEIVRDTSKKTTRYVSRGILNRIDDVTTEVLELPIGMSTDKFREYLKKLRAEEKIVDFNDYSSKVRVKFIINEDPEKMACSLKNLKMETYLGVTNMVGFDTEGKIRRYNVVDEIIYEFAQVRLKYYQLRKDMRLKTLGENLITQTAKRTFVEEVINGTIVIYKKKTAEIINVLEDKKYPVVNGDYKYLFKMPIDSFTEDMIHKLDGNVMKIKAEIEELETTTTRDMWMKELLEFEVVYKKYQKTWSDNMAMLDCGKDRKVKKPTKKIQRRAPKKG